MQSSDYEQTIMYGRNMTYEEETDLFIYQALYRLVLDHRLLIVQLLVQISEKKLQSIQLLWSERNRCFHCDLTVSLFLHIFF